MNSDAAKAVIDIQPVLLCGGVGTRLWPLSRSGFPKQFLSLTSDLSLFQLALKRLEKLSTSDIRNKKPIIVTGEDHRFLVLKQLREAQIDPETILLEPTAKNTAPALTLAAFSALGCGGDPVLVVSPADQTVGDLGEFVEVMRLAIRRAADGDMVILGIPPDHAATGYGYIHAGISNQNIFNVQSFKEKPNADAAQRYLDLGGYFWNAGLFVFKASVWLKALKAFRPVIAETVQHSWQKREVDNKLNALFVRPGKVEYESIVGESIDYAVMEQCPKSSFPLKMLSLE
ncbi:MAG: mannose-1-phosphate guanylyltransferase, partial [Burkholderiales bacterium]|nr:mannose-1-phosphate guanylyltransferase [Burkholderiales bacterium]